MKSPGPSRAERVVEIVIGIIIVVVLLALAVWLRSLFITIFAITAIVLIIAGYCRRRKLRLNEEEAIRRINQAMGKPPDDPRHMANFVP
jgi:membrane protein implicated in regulation of membrane protease activity